MGVKDRYKVFKIIKYFIEKIEFISIPLNLEHYEEKNKTFDEYNTQSFFSFKNICYGIISLYVRIIGKRISKGLKLSYHSGLNLSAFLDYIYNNKPQGIGLTKYFGIKEFMDKKYLDILA